MIFLLIGCAPLDMETGIPRQPQSSSNAEDDSTIPISLENRLQACLENGRSLRLLSSTENAAWQIMHGVVCYGERLQIVTPDRGTVGAVEYAFSGGMINGFELSTTDQLPTTGRPGIQARFEPGSYVGQGHVDQWLAIFAMADLPLDRSVMVGNREMRLEDWARAVQHNVPNNPIDEYSWTLIALTHYFPDEPVWMAAENTEVSWEMMVEYEMQQSLHEAACGGTHRMAAIARAISAKERLALPDTPVWSQAKALVADLLQDVQTHRGSDGRLSSHYFSRAGNTTDLSAELASAGHLFEFLALACDAEALASEWMETAVGHVCWLLERTNSVDLDCGSLYHALNGLKIYQQRRYGTPAPQVSKVRSASETIDA